MPSRQSSSVLHRAVGAAVSGLFLAGVLLPSAAIAAPSGPPHPGADEINTTEGQVATGNVLTNDTNGGQGTLSVLSSPLLDPTVGTLVIESDGDYTFTPALNYFGQAITSYVATNGDKTKSGTITINVANVEDAPTANDDDVTVNEDQATDVTSQLLGNDTDPDDDTLTVTSVSNEAGGDADLVGTTVTFTPPADVCGDNLATFDYAISDGNGGSDSASATVDITCVNDDPVAVDDDASGTEDADVEIAASTLLANDTDEDSDHGDLTVTAVSNAVGGTASLDSGTITFTPAPDVCGDVTFDYTVEDGDGGSDTGTVTIDLTCVNEQPVANDDTLNGTEDTDVTATGGDLTGNDTDPDGDSLTVTAVDNATGGTVNLAAGTITFTPNADACDPTDFGFDYDISDGLGGTDTGHADVSITCENDNPAATDDATSGTEDTALVITASDLADDDTDTEGDSLTVTGVSNASGGTAVLDAGEITFTPDPDLCGDDAASFDYTVEDGNGGTATGTVTIDLTCENDAPAAGDDSVSVTEDTGTDVTDAILDNDTDVDTGETLSVTDVSSATGGSVVLEGGVVTFTPSADLCGTGEGGFDYEVSDGTTTDSGHVTVDITCVNDAPSAIDDTAGGIEDTDVVITAADLAAEDTDIDLGDSLTVTAVSNPSGGTVSLATGTITFVPTANLCGDDVASFDYTVSDGHAGSDTGTVVVTLTCVNDAPNAVNDTASVAMNSGPADHIVLTNDTDVDTGDTLTLQSAVLDSGLGSASVNTGKVSYTPQAGFNGQAVITYTVSDGTDTDTATLTITVGGDLTGPVVAVPTVAFGSGRVDETAPIKVSWSATDVPSGVASYEVQQSVAGGPFKALYAGTGTSITKFYAFKQVLVFRVRAKDTLGNWSGWVNSPARRIAAFQNSNSHVAYSGTWTKVTSAKSSGAGYAYTTTKDKKARLTFTGHSVMYVAPKSSTSGKVKVYVDGTLLGTFDLNRSSILRGRIIARKSWSASGTHTIRIVAVNNGKRTSLDAFVVLK